MSEAVFMKDLLDAAKAVINYGYAPYSHFKVACALRADDGKIFAGCNVENAAYPVTMCAEATAVGTLVSSGRLKITEVLILADVEKPITPCGMCRQRLIELALPDIHVHMCTAAGKHETMQLGALLPKAFELT